MALLEFKSRPGLDEGIFESYVHLNIVVLDLMMFFSTIAVEKDIIRSNTSTTKRVAQVMFGFSSL